MKCTGLVTQVGTSFVHLPFLGHFAVQPVDLQILMADLDAGGVDALLTAL